MKTPRIVSLIAGFACILTGLAIIGCLVLQSQSFQQPLGGLEPKPVASFATMPLSFEANRGQTDPQVDFIAHGRGYELFLGAHEAMLVVRDSSTKHAADGSIPAAALRMRLRGASDDAKAVQGLDLLPGRKNYLIGNDPGKWQRDIPLFGKVKYAEVYRGVDLIYYGNQQQLEYDFVVAPGADPGQIDLQLGGARKLRINERGDLVVAVGSGEMRFHRPVAYQGDANGKIPVEVGYRLANNGSVGFLVGDYDSSRELVIDPILIYSTFVGGESFDEGNGIAVDAAGNAYIVGTSLSTQYPLTPGAISSMAPGVVVTKLNSAGSGLVYSTFLGGTAIGFTNEGFAIAVNGSGQAVVTGKTASPDFPTTANAYDKTCGTDGACNNNFSDAFLTELSADGSTLVYSTFFGGSDTDQGFAIAVDGRGAIYLAGGVASFNLPVKSAFQPACGGNEFGGCADGFVAKFDPTRSGAASLAYSTYLGGNGTDSAIGIAVDRRRNAYITGSTQSPNFPTTAGAFDRTCGADGQCDDVNSSSPGPDAFVTKLNARGSALVYSTFLGGNGTDLGAAIVVDRAGQAYVTGAVQSTDFVTTPTAFRKTLNGIQDVFITVFNAAGSSVTASTYLGGFASEGGAGIALDRNNNIHIVGTTDPNDFPTTPDRVLNYLGGEDPFIVKMPPALNTLTYATFFGSSQDDFGNAIAVSGTGTYITGSTHGPGFTTTAGAFDRECGTDGICNDDIEDAYIAKFTLPTQATTFPAVELSEFFLNFGAINVGTTSAPQPVIVTSTGTAPLLITSITATGDFAQTNDCPASLAPNQQCTINVTFTPTTSGSRAGQLQLTDNATNSPQIVTLTGTGISNAKGTLSPGNLNFGNVKVGTTSPPMIETLTSTGTTDLILTEVHVPPPFAQTNDCLGHPIAPGDHCTISITYSPTQATSDLGSVTAQGNSSVSIFASLTGRGVP